MRSGPSKSLMLPGASVIASGFVVKFDFWGKIQKSGIKNSITYRPQNSRKSNFATEPCSDLCMPDI